MRPTSSWIGSGNSRPRRFEDTPGFVFAPITEVVEPAEDPTCVHPEIQRQVVNIRTDFDRFSNLEISSLVRHGYCVGRKACRAHPEPVWSRAAARGPLGSGYPARRDRLSRGGGHARSWTVNASGCGHLSRRGHSKLRPCGASGVPCWTTGTGLPTSMSRSWCRSSSSRPTLWSSPTSSSQRFGHLVESLSQGSRDLGQMSRLLEGRQEPWIGEPAEEVQQLRRDRSPGFRDSPGLAHL